MRGVLATADALLPEFQAAIKPIPVHESGILLSEMFFFYCLVRPLNPRQILESGRDRGASTLMLALCFPHTRIASIELNAASPNAAEALAKLAPYRNVECLFGDSRELLPKLLQPGDPVMIDGPKDFRALKLALRLLRTGKPAMVFLHDFTEGLPVRRFVERHWPGVFFSDDAEFIRRFGWLENPNQTPRTTTFACLPGKLPEPYLVLLTKLVLARSIGVARVKIRALRHR